MTIGAESSEARFGGSRAQFYLWLCVFFLLMAIAAEFVGVLGLWKPKDELPEIWFQRSGAVMTIFSLLAGQGVGSALNSLEPRGMHNRTLNGLCWPFNRRFVVYEQVAMIMTIGGTIIWGYGDLIWKWAYPLLCARNSVFC